MDNFVTGNCNTCPKETQGECYEKSFGDYLEEWKQLEENRKKELGAVNEVIE